MTRSLPFLTFFLPFLCLSSSPALCTESALERGMEEYRQDNFEEALDLLENAVQDNREDARIHLYLGLTHIELGDWGAAEAALREAGRLDPQNPQISFRLAEILFRKGAFQEALSELKASEYPHPDRREVLYLKGRILLSTGQYEQAAAILETVAESDPDLAPGAKFYRAVALTEQGKSRKAERIFRGLVAEVPNSDWAVFAEDYLRVLERIPPPLSLRFLTRIEYDDNVLAVPFDQTRAGLDREGDWKNRLFFQGEYSFRADRPFSVRTSYSLDYLRHGQREYGISPDRTIFSQDTLTHTLSAAPSWSTTRSISALHLTYARREVDGASYLQSYTAAPSLIHSFSGDHLGQISARYSRREQDAGFFNEKFGTPLQPEEDRDADNFAIMAAYYHPYAEGKGLFSVSSEGEWSGAEGDNWDYLAWRATAGLSHPLSRRFKAQLFIDLYRQDFRNTHALFGKKREDMVWTAQAGLSAAVIPGLEVGITYSHTRDDSNISVFSYDRNIYGISLDYRL